MSKPTKKVVLVDTVKAAGKVVANRFVSHAGKQATADKKVYGVAPYDVEAGDAMAVEIAGIALVEAGGVVAVGDDVSADAQGCAVKTGSGEVAGTARSAAAGAGELIQVFLKG